MTRKEFKASLLLLGFEYMGGGLYRYLTRPVSAIISMHHNKAIVYTIERDASTGALHSSKAYADYRYALVKITKLLSE